MKRFFIMLAAVVLTATTLSAQIVPGMKYRDLKNMYNPRQYVRNAADPYSKGWSAVASAVVGVVVFAVPPTAKRTVWTRLFVLKTNDAAARERTD